MKQRTAGIREARRIAALLAKSNPARIIVFGSVAKGRAHPNSDIDICVLVDDLAGRPSFRVKQDLYRLLMDQRYEFPVDVEFRVYGTADFQRRLAQGDPFVREIASGRVLYEHV